MKMSLVYLYLLTPLHTGGASQEGNLLGIARESHTDLPYIPSSTIRGRLRAETPNDSPDHKRTLLWGNTIDDVTGGTDENLKQGTLWVGDGSILWLPVPSLSHGVIWVSCPLLLQRWQRLQGNVSEVPEYSTNLKNGQSVYLKDAILKDTNLQQWNEWNDFIPKANEANSIKRVVVLPDRHCATLIQMSLWRQVKVKLDVHKAVDGGFRYEEAIPPDTVMYFPWGKVNASKPNDSIQSAEEEFKNLFNTADILQIGGQESLGRGFVQTWLASED